VPSPPPAAVLPAFPPAAPLDAEGSGLPRRLPNSGNGWSPADMTRSAASLTFLVASMLFSLTGLLGLTVRKKLED
jgi:hypothetical protein